VQLVQRIKGCGTWCWYCEMKWHCCLLQFPQFAFSHSMRHICIWKRANEFPSVFFQYAKKIFYNTCTNKYQSSCVFYIRPNVRTFVCNHCRKPQVSWTPRVLNMDLTFPLMRPAFRALTQQFLTNCWAAVRNLVGGVAETKDSIMPNGAAQTRP